jgi:hypothetical protein
VEQADKPAPFLFGKHISCLRVFQTNLPIHFLGEICCNPFELDLQVQSRSEVKEIMRQYARALLLNKKLQRDVKQALDCAQGSVG